MIGGYSSMFLYRFTEPFGTCVSGNSTSGTSSSFFGCDTVITAFTISHRVNPSIVLISDVTKTSLNFGVDGNAHYLWSDARAFFIVLAMLFSILASLSSFLSHSIAGLNLF